jgi:hypothetical protein
VEKRIDSSGTNVWDHRRELRCIAASYSQISHEGVRVCTVRKKHLNTAGWHCSSLLFSQSFILIISPFCFAHAPWSFYVIRHEGKSLLGRERQSVYECFSQCLDVERQNNLYPITQFRWGKWVSVMEPSHLILHCGWEKAWPIFFFVFRTDISWYSMVICASTRARTHTHTHTGILWGHISKSFEWLEFLIWPCIHATGMFLYNTYCLRDFLCSKWYLERATEITPTRISTLYTICAYTRCCKSSCDLSVVNWPSVHQLLLAPPCTFLKSSFVSCRQAT